jgi:predicted nucleic acid-binding protein
VIVLDASVAVALLLNTPPSAKELRTILASDPEIHAPHLLDAEVAQTLRRFVHSGDLDAHRSLVALSRLAELPITLHAHGPFLARTFELRDNVTVYDGLYIALAEALRAILVTKDRRLARAPGTRAEIRVV